MSVFYTIWKTVFVDICEAQITFASGKTFI